MPSFFDKLKKGMNIENDFESPEEEQRPAVKEQKSAAEKKQSGLKKAGEKERITEKKKKFGFVANQAKKVKKAEIIQEEEPIASFSADENEDKEQETLEQEVFLPPDKKELLEIDNDKLPAAEQEEKNIKLSTVKTNIKTNMKKIEEKNTEKFVVSQKETWPEVEGELVVDVYQTENELVVQSAVAGIKPEELDIDIEKDILVIRGARQNNDLEKRDYFFQECYWGSFSRQIILPVEVDASRVKAEMREGVLTIRMPKIIKEGKKKISVQTV